MSAAFAIRIWCRYGALRAVRGDPKAVPARLLEQKAPLACNKYCLGA
jgi:hypothetical protein